MSISGTTSKILWHFTGGPSFNEKTKKREKKIKSEKEAFGKLIEILDSNFLKANRDWEGFLS